MPRKHDFADGWLFADNQQFVAGDLELPVNSDEILDNLKRDYGVYDIPIGIRIPAGLALLVLAMGLAIPIANSVSRILLEPLSLLGVINRIILIAVIPFLLFTSYVSVRLAFRLLLPQRRKVQFAWEMLVSQGTIRSGRIINKEAKSVKLKEFTYEFENSVNKPIVGTYLCKNPVALPLSIDEDGYFRMDEGVTHRPHPKPEEVKVWYVNDRIHTLL